VVDQLYEAGTTADTRRPVKLTICIDSKWRHLSSSSISAMLPNSWGTADRATRCA
jgi:hypothetical protein